MDDAVTPKKVAEATIVLPGSQSVNCVVLLLFRNQVILEKLKCSKRSVDQSQRPYTSKSISIPAMHMTQETPPVPVGTTGGVVGRVPGGLVGGLLGGVLTEVLNGMHSVPVPVLAKTSPTPKRMHIASRVAEANLIHDVAPTYPPEAGRARIEGSVVLQAVIGKDGSVQDVRVESGLPILALAAIDAVKQWRYRPYC